MLENIKDIILIILVIAVIYLICKTSKPAEHFDKISDIQTAISNQYKIDLDAMRNLGDIANKILKPNANGTYDTLDLTARTTIIENLQVKGDVTFSSKDSNIMEIFPRYMVIAWASLTIPNNWVKCDGTSYIKNTDGSFTLLTKTTTTSPTSIIIKTPDLRGRFILGEGTGIITNTDGTTTNLTSRNLNDNGGEENHILTKKEMPPHSHNIDWSTVGCTGGECTTKTTWVGTDSILSGNGDQMNEVDYVDPKRYPHITSIEGGNTSHNNMPPYYVLYYIMKL